MGARSRTKPAVVTAIVSIALFDFIFVPPYYTFAVSDASYFLTFGMMLAVGAAAARLTGRIREDADRIRQRERETAAAYALSREISKAADIAGIERCPITDSLGIQRGNRFGQVVFATGRNDARAVCVEFGPVDGVEDHDFATSRCSGHRIRMNHQFAVILWNVECRSLRD